MLPKKAKRFWLILEAQHNGGQSSLRFDPEMRYAHILARFTLS
jgi:hypothetical protein